MKKICNECKFESILHPEGGRHYATCSKYIHECLCGKESARKENGKIEYPLGECSRDCCLKMFSTMTAIKNSSKRQGSKEIVYGFPEQVEADMIYRGSKNR